MDLPGTPGLGSSPPTLWFFLPSFETRLGPPAVHWTLHQTATRNTKMSMCRTHIQRCKHTGTEVGERQGVSRDWPQGMSTDTKTRHLTLSGQFLFIGPVSLEPCCPVFGSGLAFMYPDGSNLCRNYAVSLQWFHYPSRVPGTMMGHDS